MLNLFIDYFINIPSMLRHSCFAGHLSCFQLLPTMNKAVVTFMSDSFCGHIFPFLLDKCLRVKLLNYMVFV